MKNSQLIKLLQALPADYEILLASDEEGNSIQGIDEGFEVIDNHKQAVIYPDSVYYEARFGKNREYYYMTN